MKARRQPQRAGAILIVATLGALGVGACDPPPEVEVEAPDEGIPTPRLSDVDPDVVAAIEAAKAEVRANPASDKGWGRLGNRYFVHDFLSEAEQCFERAEALNPERYVYAYRRALCCLDEDPSRAAEHLERCLPFLEEHAPAHEYYASVLQRLSRTEEAIEHYRRAVELDERAPHALTCLGQIELSRGQLEAAREHLEAALERSPKHAEAHVALAQVYLGLGREEEGKQHAELSRTLPQRTQRDDVFGNPTVAPAGARARTRYGKQLERRGKSEEAAEQYRIAIRSNPDYYAARKSLASLLAKSGRKEEGLEILREAARRNPALKQVKSDIARMLGGAQLEEEPDGE